jgi:hemoglobin
MTTAPELTETDLHALVDRFYTRVRADPQIGPVFNAAVEDWDEHLATLAHFWSSVMLATGRYKGNPLAVHLRQPIEPEMFARWLEIWGETVGEMFPPEIAALFRAKAARIAESLKLGLFFKPGG